MYMTDMKPLKPLSHGNILIVGTKQSNFDEEIRTNPRVILWDGQQESWTSKSIPQNVQAIFFTRFIGHNAFGKIVAEARKKHLTVFNPLGTGIIARQVKELLGTCVEPVTNEELMKEVETMTTTKITGTGKLTAFIPYINLDKNNRQNADDLFERSKEIGVETTRDSLANFIGAYRRKLGINKFRRNTHPKVKTVKAESTTLDAAVQMLDNAIKELKDMREFLVQTTNENKSLKKRLNTLKEMFNE